MATKTADVIPTEELKYYKALGEAAKNKSPKQLMRTQWVKMMIQRILSARVLINTEGENKLPAAIRETLATYDVVSVNGTNILILKATEREPSMMIVALEDSYEIVSQAHELTDHGDIVQMSRCIKVSNYIVNEICLQTILEICTSCDNSNTNLEDDTFAEQHTDERLALIDVIGMQHSESVSYLLIYQDFDTKFVQLRPLTTTRNMSQDICMEIIRLFADMGAPDNIKVSVSLEKMFSEIIHKVNMFANISVSFDKHVQWSKYINNLSLKVSKSLRDWMNRYSNQCWEMGCFFVQWELNNNKMKSGNTPFFKMYGRYPNTSDTPAQYKTHKNVKPAKDINELTLIEDLNLHEETDLGIFTENDLKKEQQETKIKEEDQVSDMPLAPLNEALDATITKLDENFYDIETYIIKIEDQNVESTSETIETEVSDTIDVPSSLNCAVCSKSVDLMSVQACSKCNQYMHSQCGKQIHFEDSLQFICPKCPS